MQGMWRWGKNTGPGVRISFFAFQICLFLSECTLGSHFTSLNLSVLIFGKRTRSRLWRRKKCFTYVLQTLDCKKLSWGPPSLTRQRRNNYTCVYDELYCIIKKINEQNIWFLRHRVALFELSILSKLILSASNVSIYFIEKFHGAVRPDVWSTLRALFPVAIIWWNCALSAAGEPDSFPLESGARAMIFINYKSCLSACTEHAFIPERQQEIASLFLKS